MWKIKNAVYFTKNLKLDSSIESEFHLYCLYTLFDLGNGELRGFSKVSIGIFVSVEEDFDILEEHVWSEEVGIVDLAVDWEQHRTILQES
jgi:hypothetical protein